MNQQMLAAFKSAPAGGTDIGNGWTLRAHTAKAGNGDTVTTDDIDTSIADLLIVGVAYYNGVSGDAVLEDLDDSKSNSWTMPVVTSYAVLYFCKPSSVGSGHNFTWTRAGQVPTIFVLAVSGSHASPFDQFDGDSSGAATSIVSGSITPSQNNELVVSLVSILGTASSIANDQSMTISDTLSPASAAASGALAYKTQSTAAAINVGWSWNESFLPAALVASFKHS